MTPFAAFDIYIMDSVKDKGVHKNVKTNGSKRNSGKASHLKSSQAVQKPNKSISLSLKSSNPQSVQNHGSRTKNNSVSCSREREKTQSVNTAFTLLRTLIPTEPVDRKLSKIETLRLASSYITHLSTHVLTDELGQYGISEFSEGAVTDQCQTQKICTFCLAESKKSKFSTLADYNYSSHFNGSVTETSTQGSVVLADLVEPSLCPQTIHSYSNNTNAYYY